MPKFDFKVIFRREEFFQIFFFVEKYEVRSTFFVIDIFDSIHFKSLYFLNDAQFLTARHYSNSQNSIISFDRS